MLNVKTLDPYSKSITDKIGINELKEGPQRTLWNNVAFSAPSASGGQITINGRGNTNLIDRRMYLQVTVRVSDNGGAPQVAADITAGQAERVCPRAFPVNSAIQNLQMNINGNTVSCNPSELIYPMQRFIGQTEQLTYYGTTPTQLDPVAELVRIPAVTNYACKVAAGGRNVGAASAIAFYDVDNVASPFITSPALNGSDNQQPRGYFTKTVNAGYWEYTFTECLLHPFLLGGAEQQAFTNVDKIDITINFGTDLYNRLMSHSHVIPIAGAVTVQSMSLMYREMTPPERIEIPSIQRISMSQYQVQKVAVGAVVNNAVAPVNFSNIIYNTVPSHLYIFCRPRNPTTLYGTGFLTPETISMTAGTQAGLLSGLNTQGLFMLSKDNGMDQISYGQWATGLGGVICIDCATDLGLMVGARRQLNMSFTATFRNNAFATAAGNEFDCFVVSVLPATLEITTGSANIIEGVSMEDEIQAEQAEASGDVVSVPEIVQGSGYKSFNTHGGKFGLRSFIDAGKRGLNYASTGAQIADKFGLVPPSMRGAVSGMAVADRAVNDRNAVQSMMGSGYGIKPNRRLLGSGRLGM